MLVAFYHSRLCGLRLMLAGLGDRRIGLVGGSRSWTYVYMSSSPVQPSFQIPRL